MDAEYFNRQPGAADQKKEYRRRAAAAASKTFGDEKKSVRAAAGILLFVITFVLSAGMAGCGKKNGGESSVQDGQMIKTDSETNSEGKDMDMEKKDMENEGVGNQDMEEKDGGNPGIPEFENDFAKASEALRADYEALTVRDADAVRGNLYLATAGENGSQITWESSDPAVIQAKEQTWEGNGKDGVSADSLSGEIIVPGGVVTRQEKDTKVTLYAYLTMDGVTLRKDFEVTVLAKPEQVEYTEYLFSYFVGNGVNQENVFFATSEDGFTWKDTNRGQPVLTADLGTTGIRDPFLLRSAEGDRFFLIATDLCIAKDGDWAKAQRAGSQSIFIWESFDLVNWEGPRLVKVNSDAAGCTWAPEAFYDETTGEYMVFWASRVATDGYNKQRIYYVKTRDFYHFTEPKVWIDYPFSVIDTTVIQDGGIYYRFTKYEDKSRIIMERADALLGVWTEVESETLSAQEGVEGPCCFALHEKDQVDGNRFCLLLDHFVGSGYYMMITKDLETAEFERKRGYSLPQKRPRHGTVIPVTRQEYEAVVEKYN